MKLKSLHYFGPLVYLGLLAGCDDPGDGIRGQLGVGTFDYNCLIESDAACAESGVIEDFRASNDLGNQKQLPQAVAVGSKLMRLALRHFKLMNPSLRLFLRLVLEDKWPTCSI